MSILLLLLSLLHAETKPVRIAVIDGGFKPEIVKNINLCDNLPIKVFSKTNTKHYINHGTNVVGLIKKYAENTPHCFILINGIDETVSSIKYAHSKHADIINYSAVGYRFIYDEYIAIKLFLYKKGVFFSAAGNDHLNLNKNCNAYPACYLNLGVKMVTNNKDYANKHKDAIVSDKDGDNESILDIKLNGTSQSTAIETGRYVKNLFRSK